MNINKQKIGIFGGAFDPITIGHISICNHLLDNNIIEKYVSEPCQ